MISAANDDKPPMSTPSIELILQLVRRFEAGELSRSDFLVAKRALFAGVSHSPERAGFHVERGRQGKGALPSAITEWGETR